MKNLAIFYFIFCAAFCSAKEIERIVAYVNKEVIFQSEIEDCLRSVRAQTGVEKQDEETKKKVLDQLIEEKILLQQADKEKIEISEDEVKTALENLKSKFSSRDDFDKELRKQGLTIISLRDNLKKQLKILRLIEKNVKRKIQVTDKEVREYYSRYKDDTKKKEGAAKEEIRNILFDKKFNDLFSGWMKKLKDDAVIEIR
jgi:peptidyl-prolyl cis-trans isomerase SurA